MMQVRKNMDLGAACEFFYSIFKADLQKQFPRTEVSPELLKAPLARMNLMDIYDDTNGEIAGMAGMEHDGHVHLYICKRYSCRWSPHRCLQQILDCYLTNRDRLEAAISIENKPVMGVLSKLGFRQIGAKRGTVYFSLNAADRHEISLRMKRFVGRQEPLPAGGLPPALKIQ